MKDSEFIKLLNLYLDHEISADDAARLEAEVQGNVERRRIYQEYCRMQKACKVLAHDFQTEPVAAAERKIIDFQVAAQRPVRTSSFYTIGTFVAAAACVAIIFVGRNHEQKAQESAQAQARQAVAISVQPDVQRQQASQLVSDAAPAARGITKSTPSMFSTQLSLKDEAQMAVVNGQASGQFEWLRTMQIAPLQSPNELRFDLQPTSLQTAPRTYRGPQSVDATEMSAFRFEK